MNTKSCALPVFEFPCLPAELNLLIAEFTEAAYPKFEAKKYHDKLMHQLETHTNGIHFCIFKGVNVDAFCTSYYENEDEVRYDRMYVIDGVLKPSAVKGY